MLFCKVKIRKGEKIMNKKTLAIILSIALAVGAFAGLSFNLFSASAVEYVGDGIELITNGNAGGTKTQIVTSEGA